MEDQVIEALYRAGLDEDYLRTDYSGRAMYGAECFGIVHDGQGELIRFFLYLASGDLGTEAAAALAGAAQRDSMGHSTITYFPGYTVGREVIHP